MAPFFAGLLLAVLGQSPSTPLPPVICPAGGPIGNVDLRVRSVRANGDSAPLRTINRLEEGDTILYRPLLRAGEDRKGDVALVLVPSKISENGEPLLVLPPKDASGPQEWTVPSRIAVVAFVYGPTGLNQKRVKRFLSRDQDLIAQLADYAEKTAQAEALISALSASNSSSAAVESALTGFSSQFGLTVQLDRNAPADQQAMTLFRTMTPTLARYDPIAPQRGYQVGQTAILATSVAALFFGNPVGLAAGGTALALQLRSLAFPGAEFRSSFAQMLPNDGLGLCGQRNPPPPHTRVAYLWASRIPNMGPPSLTIAGGNTLPAGTKSPLPLSASDLDWKFLERARHWSLQAEDGPPIPIGVVKLASMKMIELDLTAIRQPGKYRLRGKWDWDAFNVNGVFDVRPASDLSMARVAPSSRDALQARSGRIPVTIEGADFEFVTKVEMEKPDDRFGSRGPVPFLLPRGLRKGPQDKMDIQINTADLDPGRYRLTLTQADGRADPVELKVLPPPPKIENLPVLLNQGEAADEFLLKGERLELVDRIEIPRGRIELGPAGTNQTERMGRVILQPGIAAGTNLAARAFIADRTEPLVLPDAVRITAPRPQIVEGRVSVPPDQEVSLETGELPGSSYLSAKLRVEHLRSNSALKLSCEQSGGTTVLLRMGQSYGAVSLQQLSMNELFVSFDTGVWLNGCRLQATIANGPEGDSDPYPLGSVLRAPKIDSLSLHQSGFATLTGQNLETIEKIGWSAEFGEPVHALPLPLASDSRKQTLQVCLPVSPNPEARLHVWLRGELKARTTKAGS